MFSKHYQLNVLSSTDTVNGQCGPQAARKRVPQSFLLGLPLSPLSIIVKNMSGQLFLFAAGPCSMNEVWLAWSFCFFTSSVYFILSLGDATQILFVLFSCHLGFRELFTQWFSFYAPVPPVQEFTPSPHSGKNCTFVVMQVVCNAVSKAR